MSQLKNTKNTQKGGITMPAYKDEKTGLWYCKFVYTDWNGEKKQKKKKGFKFQKDAKAFESEFLNTNNLSFDMKFSSLVGLYMEDAKVRLKATSYYGKEFMINEHIVKYLGDMKISDIDATTIRRWQTKLISNPKSYSPTYLKCIHNQISAIFNFACKYYKLPENPARICGAMGKKNADTMQFWTVAEFKQFIEETAYNHMSYVMFNLLFYTGMRSGELLALTGNDIDLEERIITINKTFTQLKGEELITEPKTPKSKRKVTIPPNVAEIIEEYIDMIAYYNPKERLFPTTRGFLTREMQRCCEKSGVKKIRVHDLRHSHASLLIELGFSPLLIAERLGHEEIETTLQTYSHLYPNKQHEVSDRLQLI